MILAAVHGRLVSAATCLRIVCLTAFLIVSLSSVASARRGGGFGGGHVGGGGFVGGHVGSFGGGHVGNFGGGHVGNFGGGQFHGGRFGAGHFAGGRFGGRQFGRFPGRFHNFGNNRFFFHHGRGFHGVFVFDFPFGVPYYAYAPYPYPYYAGPYCDPYSPWYNPSYCYWRYRAY
jgi:hypothetical protein